MEILRGFGGKEGLLFHSQLISQVLLFLGRKASQIHTLLSATNSSNLGLAMTTSHCCRCYLF